MADRTLSEGLASYYTALEFQRIPADIIDSAKLHILDSLGCLLAGSRLQAGKLAYALAIANSGKNMSAPLLGSGQRVSLLDAVEAMSVAAHCGEMDDIHAGAGTCIGAMVIPALFAMTKKYGGSGRKMIEATIAGYETIIRVGLSIDAPKLFARGWWPSTICGAFGVAAACAKFLDWEAIESANALGIAALHSGGMLTGGNEGATARHLAFGHAAQNGIQSVMAARQGFTGPHRAFEDSRGFGPTLCSEPKWEHLRSFDAFHLPEVAFKPYPCARQLHAGVEALLKILRPYSLRPETIDEIELCLPTQNAAMMNRPSITPTHAATVGSGQYVMAVTAVRGKMDLCSFEDEFLHDDQVRRLAKKVKVSPSAELDRHYPKYWPGRVAVRATDGAIHSQEVIIPKGESGNPMTAGEIEEKFLSLAAPVVGDERALLVQTDIGSLEERQSLEGVLAALVS
ncbi:MAG TPA: MmgE/PrpD family protein [Candidatus Binatia bacterium]